jgi:sugar/nucleoside kinase (ribokinase family)
MFDIAYIGHYTKDTIVYPHEVKVVDGGAFYYGAHVIARMGLRCGVVTNLAREDWRVVKELEQLGVQVLARESQSSTGLRLVYPNSNLDERMLEITSQADPFTVEQIQGIQSKALIIGASVRGEVPIQVLAAIAEQTSILALDVQGFLRSVQNGKLIFDSWPDRAPVLKLVTILKSDAVEATILTGEEDRRIAAKKLAEYGPREILLTHSGGILVYHDGIFDEAPFLPHDVRGRSGRGDTCTAAYVARRLTAPPSDAVLWAAAVTSLKLEAEGPFRAEISLATELYEQMKKSKHSFLASSGQSRLAEKS